MSPWFSLPCNCRGFQAPELAYCLGRPARLALATLAALAALAALDALAALAAVAAIGDRLPRCW